jgi:DNA polymerase elongation subunit (family B)
MLRTLSLNGTMPRMLDPAAAGVDRHLQQDFQQHVVAPVQLHYYASEQALLQGFCAVVQGLDPDVIVGWDLQQGSVGYLADRGAQLGFNLLRAASRTPEVSEGTGGWCVRTWMLLLCGAQLRGAAC